MLLQEKMRVTSFSSSEQLIVDFMLEKQDAIKEYSTTMIAEETYTSASMLVRIAKKLGFHGYQELKEAFLQEVMYLRTNFQNINANLPFLATDTQLDIAGKLRKLKQESLFDTLQLLDPAKLQKAIKILENSETIHVFAISNMTFQAEEFVFKMRHIGKSAQTYSISNMLYQEALMAAEHDCAICISYSGETGELLETMNILKGKQLPIIAITSIGQNSLTKLADVQLSLTTREKAYSKIAGFSSLESISFLLDIIYSCYFATNYQKHYTYKTKVAQASEQRHIDNHIVREDVITE